MAVIDIKVFGGEIPSSSSRAIPPNSARVAKNLLARINEFRPLQEDLVAASGSGQTIYRMSRSSSGEFNDYMSSGWITRPNVVNFVRGQINDDFTERTYYTAGDGSVPPRVTNALGFDKRLGVPVPAKPSTSLLVTEEYTPEEEAKLPITINDAVDASLVKVMLGTEPSTGIGSDGNQWINTDQARSSGWSGISDGDWAYLIPMKAEGSSYVLVTPALIYFQNASFYGKRITYAGQQWWSIIMAQQAAWYAADRSIFEASMKAIVNPATGEPLLTDSPELTATIDSVVEWFDVSKAADDVAAMRKAQLNVWAISTQSDVAKDSAAALLSAIATFNSATKALRAKWEQLREDVTEAISLRYIPNELAAVLPEVTTRVLDTRFYVVTYVTDWGEESAPSPVSDMVEADQNDTVDVACPAPPSGRYIAGWRLYRTNTGSQTAAFQLVDDVDAANAVLTGSGEFDYYNIGALMYSDAQRSVELDEVLPTLTWLEPPANLRGLTGMANGVMAGFFDNCVCFCEPYVPYAWPVEYQITTKYPIVGLGAFGQTLFVGTRGIPYLISGADSASMSAIEAPGDQACSSARSIVSVDNGVLYASPDGICLADQNGVRVVTQQWLTREDWQKLNPSTMIAGAHDGVYYLFYGAGCYAMDFAATRLVSLPLTCTAVFNDKVTDTLYIAAGGSIKALFSANSHRVGLYRTGIMQMQKQVALAWLQVDSDYSAPVTVRWYGDGVLRYTATLTSITPVRLSPGRWLEHEVEIETSARVTRLSMASSTAELQSI